MGAESGCGDISYTGMRMHTSSLSCAFPFLSLPPPHVIGLGPSVSSILCTANLGVVCRHVDNQNTAVNCPVVGSPFCDTCSPTACGLQSPPKEEAKRSLCCRASVSLVFCVRFRLLRHLRPPHVVTNMYLILALLPTKRQQLFQSSFIDHGRYSAVRRNLNFSHPGRVC